MSICKSPCPTQPKLKCTLDKNHAGPHQCEIIGGLAVWPEGWGTPGVEPQLPLADTPDPAPVELLPVEDAIAAGQISAEAAAPYRKKSKKA